MTSADATVPQETERKNIIRELLETERKYVQDLEVMQVCPLLRSSFGIVFLANRDLVVFECFITKPHH